MHLFVIIIIHPAWFQAGLKGGAGKHRHEPEVHASPQNQGFPLRAARL